MRRRGRRKLALGMMEGVGVKVQLASSSEWSEY